MSIDRYSGAPRVTAMALPCTRMPKVTWLGRGRRNRLRLNLARSFALAGEAGARYDGGPSTEDSGAGTERESERSGRKRQNSDSSSHRGAVSSHHYV